MARPKKPFPPKKEHRITIRMTEDMYFVFDCNLKFHPRVEFEIAIEFFFIIGENIIDTVNWKEYNKLNKMDLQHLKC